MKYFLLVLSLVLVSACTSIQVKKIDRKIHDLKRICILKNEKVLVTDFLSVMKDEFRQRHIKTKVYRENVPEGCKYSLEYTARRSWDVAPFLSLAEIRILKDGELIASADYKLSNGLNLDKWSSTAKKMKPVYLQLFGE